MMVRQCFSLDEPTRWAGDSEVVVFERPDEKPSPFCGHTELDPVETEPEPEAGGEVDWYATDCDDLGSTCWLRCRVEANSYDVGGKLASAQGRYNIRGGAFGTEESGAEWVDAYYDKEGWLWRKWKGLGFYGGRCGSPDDFGDWWVREDGEFMTVIDPGADSISTAGYEVAFKRAVGRV
jgi:hypothetical protein